MASSEFNSSSRNLDLDDKEQTQSQLHGNTETHHHHHHQHGHDHLHERGLADTQTLVLGPNIPTATALENGTTTASDQHLLNEKSHHHNDAADGNEVTREQTIVDSNGNNGIEKTDTVTTVDDESQYPSGLKLGCMYTAAYRLHHYILTNS